MSSAVVQKHVVLGNEYDENLRDHLRDVLRELGANLVDRWRGVGGSQEVERLEVNLGGKLIVIEAETYVGLSIAGDAEVIDEVATRVRSRI